MSGENSNAMSKKAPRHETEEEVEQRFANATKKRIQTYREAFSRGEVTVDRWWYRGKKYGKK